MGSPYGLLSLDRETYGVATFRILSIVGLGACCRPGGSMVHDAARYRRHSRLHCLLAQASQPLWLVLYHGLYRRFTLVHLTDYLALYPDEASRKERLSRFAPRIRKRCFRHCPGSS